MATLPESCNITHNLNPFRNKTHWTPVAGIFSLEPALKTAAVSLQETTSVRSYVTEYGEEVDKNTGIEKTAEIYCR